ncbi:hypothetical protein AB0I49_25515 [Streptomyces sp. NPDC050617]|uniref:hypothetical protein n=1 Tax=Streptomyces sp. NPDC050617 TaxID=3154628 RepID=UPI00342929E6
MRSPENMSPADAAPPAPRAAAQPPPPGAAGAPAPPGRAETELLMRGIITATAPPQGICGLQDVLLRALAPTMTGHRVEPAGLAPLGRGELRRALAHRDAEFRTWVGLLLLVNEVILAPLTDETCERVADWAAEAGAHEGLVALARSLRGGDPWAALIDFERVCGHRPSRRDHTGRPLDTAEALAAAWRPSHDDPRLAARWSALADCPPGSLGLAVHRYFLARGFAFPGRPGSTPAYLTQHDWAHVVTDYGTTLDTELEVFALVARALLDRRGFELLAWVVGLYLIGYTGLAAAQFEAAGDRLSRADMAVRMEDAFRRGARIRTDLLSVDWFALADQPLERVRADLGVPAKSPAAHGAGTAGPFEPGGIDDYQIRAGRRMAEAAGAPYEAYGAAVA